MRSWPFRAISDFQCMVCFFLKLLRICVFKQSALFPIQASKMQTLMGEFQRRTSSVHGPTHQKMRQTIKAAADFVWSGLEKKDKDQPHIQFLTSWLNGSNKKGGAGAKGAEAKRLDCFGICTAILCVLTSWGVSKDQVWLTMSEDHAWLTFQDFRDGPLETAEVSCVDSSKRGR